MSIVAVRGIIDSCDAVWEGGSFRMVSVHLGVRKESWPVSVVWIRC